mgnify:CR=1 FL=1
MIYGMLGITSSRVLLTRPGRPTPGLSCNNNAVFEILKATFLALSILLSFAMKLFISNRSSLAALSHIIFIIKPKLLVLFLLVCTFEYLDYLPLPKLSLCDQLAMS